MNLPRHEFLKAGVGGMGSVHVQNFLNMDGVVG